MSISFSGLASGLDTSSWVQSLTALKRAKVTTLQQEKTEAANVQDAIANIKSFFTSFRSTLEKVTDSKLFSGTSMDVFTKKLAASTKTDVVTATATSTAKEATYNIEVEKLATATEAVSKYTANYEKIKTANLDSKLTSLGVDIANEGSQIKVNKNGVESTITLNKSDTIATFLNKLKNVGVEGSFNEKTGSVSLNVGKNDITDVSGTGIKTALHLENVNSGYESAALTTTRVENVVQAASRDTRMSDLGITNFAGKTFGANFEGGYQELSFEDAEDNTKSITLGNLIDFINTNGGSASIDENGRFEVSGISLNNDFSVDVFDALGLNSQVTETSQTSKALKITVEDTVGDPITGNTALGEIFDFSAPATSIGVNRGVLDEELTPDTTVDEFLNILNTNGLTASLSEDGVISISGGDLSLPFVTNFTNVFNNIKVGYVGDTKTLTEEVTTNHTITADTKISDLGITAGAVGIINANGEEHSFVLNENSKVKNILFGAYILNHNAGENTSYIDRMNTNPSETAYDSNEDVYINQETGQIVFKNLTFSNLTPEKIEAIQEMQNDEGIEESNAISVLFGANLADNQAITSSEMTSEKLYYTEVGIANADENTLISNWMTNPNAQDAYIDVYDKNGNKLNAEGIAISGSDTIQDLCDKINAVNPNANAGLWKGKLVFDAGYITSNCGLETNMGLTEDLSVSIVGVAGLNDTHMENVTLSDSLESIVGINPNNDFMSGIQRITDSEQISSENWTTVSTAQGFADALSGGAEKILLTGDIDFDGFSDYGTAASDVTINGNGYTISNLNKGLFSTLEDSEIYNLKLEGTITTSASGEYGFLANTATGTINVHNVTVDGTINTSNNSEKAGLLVGQVNNGATLTLNDISVSGTVGTTQANVEDHTEISGGMVGYITSDCTSTITNVYADTDVYGNVSGGVIGVMEFVKNDNCENSKIENVMSTYSNYESANSKSAFVGEFSMQTIQDSSAFSDWCLTGNCSNLYTYDNSSALFNLSVDGQSTPPFSMDNSICSILTQPQDNKGFIIKNQNGNTVATVDTSSCSTLSDLLGTLGSYGFEYSINDGVISITNETNNYYLADTSLTQSLGITTDSASATSTSQRHQKEVTVSPTGSSLLNDMGITNGTLNINLSKTGSHSFTIDSSTTTDDLANALREYGCDVVQVRNGFLCTTQNSDLTIEAVGTNFMEKYLLDNEEAKRCIYNQSSESLQYNTYTPTEISGTTKLVDITGWGDSEVNDFALETGYYHIFTSDGVQHTEEITNNTTVNDFLSTLRGYGFDATISGAGRITIESNGNAYVAESNYVDNNSNIASLLNLTQTKDITTDSLGYSTVSNENITRSTKLSDINSDTPYQEGYVKIKKANGNDANIYLEADETVGSFLDKLVANGVDAAVTDGVISVNSQTAYLDVYDGMGTASNIKNVLSLNGFDVRNYVTDPIHILDPENAQYDVAADRNTALSDLGVTTGEYNIYNNGVKYTAYVSSDETLGSFVDTLKSFGLSVGVFNEGDQTIVKLSGNGNSYLETSAGANASNIVSTLFNSPEAKNAYAGNLETEREEITNPLADENTLVSELAGAWGESVAGNVVVNVNDVESSINISNEDSIGAVLERFRQLGIDATIADGKITMQGGFNTFSIDSSKSTSSLANPSAATGLIRNEDMDGYVSSSETILATTQETRDVSVANWADMDTKLGLMNITSGSLSVYKDGAKAVVHVDSSQTFAELKDAINTEFGGSDIELSFDEGLLKIYSLSGANVEVGSGIDTSNFSSITGMQKGDDGIATSVRELYKVNSSSLITQEGLFRRGDVFAGDFIIGDTTFTIDDTTTIGDLVNMINNSSTANVSAYWDNVTGNFVITSKTTGASYINIELNNNSRNNVTNFTDIMGYTASTWTGEYSNDIDNGRVTNGDSGSNGRGGQVTTPASSMDIGERQPDSSEKTILLSTRMLAENQNLGQNAKFKINGTSYTSTTNTISSDISRIEGVTLNLKGLSNGESAQVTISKDKEKVADTMEEVVNAYNELMENVDKEIAASGTLSGESTLKMIRNQLRTLMTGSESGMTKFLNLDSIGIGVSKAAAGNVSTVNSSVINLAFDRDKFTSAYEDDASELKKLLLGTEEDSSSGIFNRVENVLNNALKSVTGYFDIATKTQTNKISNLNDKITRQNQHVERYKQQLEKKFKTMDMLISQMNERYSSLLNGGF